MFATGFFSFEAINRSDLPSWKLGLKLAVLGIRCGDVITIDAGRLQNDDAGGSIRYKASRAVADDTALGVAIQALSNFEYDSLTSDVSYTEDGDLFLNMRLQGINPDLDATQPVVLNLNLENNVPQMLRSMRATRNIQEIFQRRLNDE